MFFGNPLPTLRCPATFEAWQDSSQWETLTPQASLVSATDGKPVKPHTGYISYYANVFNGHDGWKVESRVDGLAWNGMRRVIDWDPAYAKLYLDQDTQATPLATPRLPDPVVCYHLWRSYLPADLAAGTHVIEVRATDPAGQVFTAKREVKVVEPQK